MPPVILCPVGVVANSTNIQVTYILVDLRHGEAEPEAIHFDGADVAMPGRYFVPNHIARNDLLPGGNHAKVNPRPVGCPIRPLDIHGAIPFSKTDGMPQKPRISRNHVGLGFGASGDDLSLLIEEDALTNDDIPEPHVRVGRCRNADQERRARPPVVEYVHREQHGRDLSGVRRLGDKDLVKLAVPQRKTPLPVPAVAPPDAMVIRETERCADGTAFDLDGGEDGKIDGRFG